MATYRLREHGEHDGVEVGEREGESDLDRERDRRVAVTVTMRLRGIMVRWAGERRTVRAPLRVIWCSMRGSTSSSEHSTCGQGQGQGRGEHSGSC